MLDHCIYPEEQQCRNFTPNFFVCLFEHNDSIGHPTFDYMLNNITCNLD